MIIDKISKIDNYSEIPDFAKDFIKSITVDIEEGRYELAQGAYANVESYTTKRINEGKFEAHKNFIDIQLLLKGKERIYYTGLDWLNVGIPYNSEKDIMFFSDNIKNSDYLTLDGSNFAVIYPHEAHAPQIALDEAGFVKKVVVKINI